jgi:AcrR family transcriptional regulator
MSVNETESGTTTARRTAIVAAAARLFRQRGFAQVGIDDIGAELGLSGPALYRYVDSKQALLAEVVIGHLDQIAHEHADPRRSPAVAAGPVDPELIRAVVTAALRDPNGLFVTIRYSGLLTGAPLARAQERREQFAAAWDPVLLQVQPAAAWSASELRTRAVAGLLTHLALTRSGSQTQRGALARECVADLCSVALAPVTPPPDVPADAVVLTHASRREATLSAAISLFCERGYAAVSLNDIGAEVGITGSAVARQFGSKEDLLATALVRGSEQISAGVALALRRSTSAEQAVGALLASYVTLAVDFPELVVVQNIEPYALSAHYRSERRKRHRVYVDELTRLIELAHPGNAKAMSRLRAGATFAALNEAVYGSVRTRGVADSDNLLRIASVIALAPPPG